MIAHQLAEELRRSKQYFDRSTSALQEEDAGYAPADGLMHTAGMMAHVAQTVDWFTDAAFTDKGFVMDFEGMGAQAMAVTSLADARKWVDKAYARAIEAVDEVLRRRDHDAVRAQRDHGTDPEGGVRFGDRRPHRASSRRAGHLRSALRPRAADAVHVIDRWCRSAEAARSGSRVDRSPKGREAGAPSARATRDP